MSESSYRGDADCGSGSVVRAGFPDICHYPDLILGQFYKVIVNNDPDISFVVVKCIPAKGNVFDIFFISQCKRIALGIDKKHLIKQAGVVHLSCCLCTASEKNFAFCELRIIINLSWCKDIPKATAC